MLSRRPHGGSQSEAGVTHLSSQDDLSVPGDEERAEGVLAGHGPDHLQGRPESGSSSDCQSVLMVDTPPPSPGATHLFQTLTMSPEADRMARLSELKASVRTSVRCPPSVRRAVFQLLGVCSPLLRL